jgi:hypothetical protein
LRNASIGLLWMGLAFSWLAVCGQESESPAERVPQDVPAGPEPGKAPGGDAKPKALPPAERYWSRMWEFEGLDAAAWKARFARWGAELPVDLEGQFSGSIEIRIPRRSMFSLPSYQLRGTVRSEQLLVENVHVREFLAELLFTSGVLSLEQLQFQLPPPEGSQGPTGSVQGTATAQLVPRGQLQAELQVRDIPASIVKYVYPDWDLRLQGSLTGSVTARTAVAQLRDVDAWSGEGELQLGEFVAGEFPEVEGRGEFSLNQGQLVVEALSGTAAGAELDATGNLVLDEQLSFESELRLEGLELEQLQQFAAGLHPEWQALTESLLGTVNVRAQATGRLQPVSFSATGSFSVAGFQLQEVQVQEFTTSYELSPQSLRLDDLSAMLHGGRVEGWLVVPLPLDDPVEDEPPPQIEGQLEWRDVPLARSLAPWFDVPEQLRAEMSGQLAFSVPSEVWRQLDQWRIRGRMSVPMMTWQDVRIADATASFGQVPRQPLAWEATGELLNAPWQAAGTVQLTDSLAYQAHYTLGGQRFMVARELAAPLPPLASEDLQIQGKASGTLAPIDYALDASWTATGLTLGNLRVERLAGETRIVPERWVFTDLQWRQDEGLLTGSVKLPSPPADPAQQEHAEIDLRWRSFPVNSLLRIAGVPDELSAVSTGQLSASGPLEPWPQFPRWNWKPWTLTTELQVPEVWWDDLRWARLQLQANKAEGEPIQLTADGQLAEADWTLDARWSGDFQHPVTADVSLTGQQLSDAIWQRVRPYAVEAGGVRLQANLSADLAEHMVTAEGKLSLDHWAMDDLRLDQLTTQFKVAGELAAPLSPLAPEDRQIRASGTLAPIDYSLDASWTATGLAFGNLRVERLAGQTRASPERWVFSDLQWRQEDGLLTGSVALPSPLTDLAQQEPVEIDLRWQSFPVDSLLRIAGVPDELSAVSTGQLSASGPLEPWPQFPRWNWKPWTLTTELQVPEVWWDDLRWARLQLQANKAEGEPIQLTADGQLAEADWTLDARWSGDFQHPVTADVSLTGQQLSDAIWQRVRPYAVEAGGVRLQANLSADLAEHMVTAEGKLSLDHWAMDDLRLDQLTTQFKVASGTLAPIDYALEASWTATGLTLGNLRVERLDGETRASPERWVFSDLQWRQEDGLLTGFVALPSPLTDLAQQEPAEIELRWQSFPVDSLLRVAGVPDELSAVSTGQLSASGPLEPWPQFPRWNWKPWTLAAELQVPEVWWDDLRWARLQLHANKVDGEPFQLTANGQLAEADWTVGARWSGDIQHPVTADVSLTGQQLSDAIWQRVLPYAVEAGGVRLQANLSADLAEFAVTAEGRLSWISGPWMTCALTS